MKGPRLNIYEERELAHPKTTFCSFLQKQYPHVRRLYSSRAAVHKKSSAADCLAAPRRNFEADSAAPWQRAPPLDHVQVAAVRAAWHES